MNQQAYFKLSVALQELLRQKEIPLHWGAIQNNKTDGKIKLFDIELFDELKIALTGLDHNEITYFKRRWFLMQCAKCDEYLFNLNINVKANPNSRGQDYDIQFNDDQTLRFDVKGTCIPKSLRAKAELLVKDPTGISRLFI